MKGLDKDVAKDVSDSIIRVCKDFINYILYIKKS